MKPAFAVVLACGICGCAATGASYEEFSRAAAMRATQARLVLFRTTESHVASAVAAAVKVNGSPAARVQYGGFAFVDVEPGRHVLTVDLPATRGQCDLSIDTAAGMEYYFQVKPRVENLGLGAIPMLLAKGDQPWSPRRPECQGSFYAEPTEKQVALDRLKTLKLSQ